RRCRVGAVVAALAVKDHVNRMAESLALLFADIQRSTRLLDRLGERPANLLAERPSGQAAKRRWARMGMRASAVDVLTEPGDALILWSEDQTRAAAPAPESWDAAWKPAPNCRSGMRWPWRPAQLRVTPR